MNARENVALSQNLVLRFIRRAGGDDIRALHDLIDARAGSDTKAQRLQIAPKLFHRLWVNVVDGYVINPP